jgi:hypothetical protein
VPPGSRQITPGEMPRSFGTTSQPTGNRQSFSRARFIPSLEMRRAS